MEKVKRINLEKIQSSISAFYDSHKNLVKVIVSFFWVGVIGYLLYLGWKSRDELIYSFNNADWPQFVWVILAYLSTLIFASCTWASIMHTFDQTQSWWMHVRIYLTTLVARRLPGTVWYIGGRMALYKQLGVSSVKTASASGVEVVTGFVANSILALIFLPFGLGISNYWLIPLSLAALFGLGILIPSNLAKVMIRLKNPLPQPIKGQLIALWLILRMAQVLAGGTMVFLTVKVFYPISTGLLFLALGARAIAGAASMLTFLLPSSFGVYDLTMLGFLATILPASLATVITVLIKLYSSAFEAIFGLIFFLILRRSPEFKQITLNTIANKPAEDLSPTEPLSEHNSEG